MGGVCLVPVRVVRVPVPVVLVVVVGCCWLRVVGCWCVVVWLCVVSVRCVLGACGEKQENNTYHGVKQKISNQHNSDVPTHGPTKRALCTQSSELP